MRRSVAFADGLWRWKSTTHPISALWLGSSSSSALTRLPTRQVSILGLPKGLLFYVLFQLILESDRLTFLFFQVGDLVPENVLRPLERSKEEPVKPWVKGEL